MNGGYKLCQAGGLSLRLPHYQSTPLNVSVCVCLFVCLFACLLACLLGWLVLCLSLKCSTSHVSVHLMQMSTLETWNGNIGICKERPVLHIWPFSVCGKNNWTSLFDVFLHHVLPPCCNGWQTCWLPRGMADCFRLIGDRNSAAQWSADSSAPTIFFGPSERLVYHPH